ncbi:MAG: hypothetical protein VXB01_05350 [Opitutae bacterium]
MRLIHHSTDNEMQSKVIECNRKIAFWEDKMFTAKIMMQSWQNKKKRLFATHCELCGKEDKYLDRGMCMDCIKTEYADSDNI